jgi:BNR repeat-like domain/Two component regulator propeller
MTNALIRWRSRTWRETVTRAWLGMLVAGMVVLGCSDAAAQGPKWGQPAMLSTNLPSSWWPDIAADDSGKAYAVWNGGRSDQAAGDVLDLLMYSAWDGQAWSEPKDIILAARGGWTIRPALTIDASNVLHLTYRSREAIYHASAPASAASYPSSWSAGHRLSGSGNGYYSDVAVDGKGIVHVVWNEQVAATPDTPMMWAGTMGGMAQWDGYRWMPHGLQEGLGGGQIHTIWEDAAGVQWFGTSNGALSFDGATWKTFTVQDGLADNDVYAIVEDNDGVVWFGTGKGVSSYDAKRGDAAWSAYMARDGLASNRITAAAGYQGRVLWFGTDQGISRYDGRTWVSYSVADGLVDNAVTALAIGADGVVWIGTEKGLSRYDGQTWVTFTSADGLVHSHVTSLVIDQKGTVWVGTKGGVSWYQGGQWTGLTTADGLVDNRVTAIAVDRTGMLWAGTESGIGRFDGKTWTTYTSRDGLAQDRVTALAEDRIVNAACPLCADIYYRRSTDGGGSWSPPVNLSRSYAGSVKPQIVIDRHDAVHVVWEEGEDWYAAAGEPASSAYVHSLDGGVTWSQPSIFTMAGGAPQQPALGVGQDGELIVVWRLPDRKDLFYQRSTDSGDSWSAPAPVPGVIAKPWSPMSLDSCSAVGDSGGHVHVLVLGRFSEREEALSVMHVEWDGKQWLSPTAVFASTDPPEWPRIAVGGGNRLFGIWFTRDKEHVWDSANGRYQVWASFLQTTAPAETPVPLPTRTPNPTSVSQPVLRPTATIAPTLAPGVSGLPAGLKTESDDLVRMLVALAPLVVLVLILVASRMGWIRRILERVGIRR